MKGPSIIVAAALTVAAISLCPAAQAAGPTTTPSANRVMSNTLAAVAKPVAQIAPETRIRSTLDRLSQTALTPNGMSRLVALLDHSQRESISKSSTYSQGYGSKLDAQISTFNKTWKQKYGHEFAMASTRNAFASSSTSIRMTAPVKKSGLETATAAITTGSGSEALDVPLICTRENQWKIDAPASLTAEKLRGNLLAELTAVNSQSARWPTQEATAYRTVTDHVLMAVLDKPMPVSNMQATALPKPASHTVQPVVVQVKPAAAQSKPAAVSKHHWWQFWD